MGREGVEPSTSRLSGVRSNHLSYRPISSGPCSLAHILGASRPKHLVEPIGIEPMTY